MAAAAVAVVACLTAAGTAAVVAVTRDDSAGPATGDGPSTLLSAPGETARPAFADGQTVYGDRGDNAAFGIPSGADYWETTAVLDAVSWTGEDGELALLGPAIYGLQSCPEEESQAALGFAGFVVPLDDTGEGADVLGRRVIERFTEAMVYPEKRERPGRVVEAIDSADAETADGTQAVLYRATVRPSGIGACDSPRSEVSILCFDSGAYYTTVMLVRELEHPSAFDAKESARYPLMTEDTRDRILASVRLLSPATATSTVEPSESDSDDPDGSDEPGESDEPTSQSPSATQ